MSPPCHSVAPHCLRARITGPSYAPSQYVDFSYADETGEIDTRRFHMKPGVANGDMGGAFYEAIRTIGRGNSRAEGSATGRGSRGGGRCGRRRDLRQAPDRQGEKELQAL